MGRTLLTRNAVMAGAAALLVAACTTHKQETPSLTGPSGLGTSLVITVSPDVLNQDGASQSLVQVQAYDNNGQPLRNASLRVATSVDGFITDFGRLSAKNIVTDGSGRASLTYTAPAPVLGITSTINVDVLVTPAESDFGNSTTRRVTIHVIPTGVVGPPTSPFIPDFAAPSATVGNPATFVATSTGTSANAGVATYVWDFGDGDTTVGQTVQHTFGRAGAYLVTLAVIDTLGRVNEVTHSVTVGQGTVPTVSEIIISPSSPAVGQIANFSAITSVESGHRIVAYDWNFGDATFGSGEFVQHSYTAAGDYTVTLRVTDDVGRQSTLQTTGVTVSSGSGGGTASGATQANFTFSPSSPSATSDGTATLVFNGGGSVAATGRTIASYVWTFGSGSAATGQTVTKSLAVGTYQVTLTVTDSEGQAASKTRQVTVAAS